MSTRAGLVRRAAPATAAVVAFALLGASGEIDMDAEITGIGPDPNPANNHQRAVVIVCAEKAADPSCN